MIGVFVVNLFLVLWAATVAYMGVKQEARAPREVFVDWIISAVALTLFCWGIYAILVQL